MAAFVEMNNILLVIVEALRTWSCPSALEIVGFVLGITGGLCFVFPDEIERARKCVAVTLFLQTEEDTGQALNIQDEIKNYNLEEMEKFDSKDTTKDLSRSV